MRSSSGAFRDLDVPDFAFAKHFDNTVDNSYLLETLDQEHFQLLRWIFEPLATFRASYIDKIAIEKATTTTDDDPTPRHHHPR